MSYLTGDYGSLAEAVGEAPPSPRFCTGAELDELEWNCAGDLEMADHILSYAAREDSRNREWYSERYADADEYERVTTERDLYRRALIDAGVDIPELD